MITVKYYSVKMKWVLVPKTYIKVCGMRKEYWYEKIQSFGKLL